MMIIPLWAFVVLLLFAAIGLVAVVCWVMAYRAWKGSPWHVSPD